MEVISCVKLVSFFLCEGSVFPGGKVAEKKHKDNVSISDTGHVQVSVGVHIYMCGCLCVDISVLMFPPPRQLYCH